MCHITVTETLYHEFLFDIGGNIIECDLNEVQQLCEHCRQIIEHSTLSSYYDEDE